MCLVNCEELNVLLPFKICQWSLTLPVHEPQAISLGVGHSEKNWGQRGLQKQPLSSRKCVYYISSPKDSLGASSLCGKKIDLNFVSLTWKIYHLIGLVLVCCLQCQLTHWDYFNRVSTIPTWGFQDGLKPWRILKKGWNSTSQPRMIKHIALAVIESDSRSLNCVLPWAICMSNI